MGTGGFIYVDVSQILQSKLTPAQNCTKSTNTDSTFFHKSFTPPFPMTLWSKVPTCSMSLLAAKACCAMSAMSLTTWRYVHSGQGVEFTEPAVVCTVLGPCARLWH